MTVRRSLYWTYLAQVVGFLVTFLSTIVVARLVTPRDFGIFAMASAVTIIINVFMQFGLAKYLLREKELDQKLLRALFTVNALISLAYVTLILLGSIAADSIFHSAEVAKFLAVFALFPIFSMMEFMPAALCAREMRFGAIAALNVVRAMILAIATIVLAFEGFAYMSFAWAQVLAWLTTAIGYNIIVWRPDVWRLRFVGVRSILQFGAQMIGISGVGQLSTRAGEMTLGSMLGLAQLGLYTRASGIPTSLYSTVYAAGSNVIFSRLSQDLRTTGALHLTYIRFMSLMLGVLWPMMFGLAVLAQPAIHLLYGPHWQGAALPLSILSVAYAITVGIGMTSELFILRHETARQMKIESVRAVAGLVLFAGGALISLPAAAAAKLAESILTFFLYRRPMTKLVAGPTGELRRVYVEASLLSGAAIAPSFILMIWTGWSALTELIDIIVSVSVGILMWAALLVKLRHPLVMEVSRFFRQTLIK